MYRGITWYHYSVVSLIVASPIPGVARQFSCNVTWDDRLTITQDVWWHAPYNTTSIKRGGPQVRHQIKHQIFGPLIIQVKFGHL